MGNSLLSYTSNFSSVSGDSNEYYGFFDTADNEGTFDTDQTRFVYRSAGTLSDFWGRIIANSISVSTTHKIRKNGVDGSQTFSVNANTTGTFTDTSHTTSVSAGDKMNVSINLSSNSGTITPGIYSAVFAASTQANTVVRCVASDFSVYNDTSTTMYGVSIGSDEGNSVPTTEGSSKNRQRKAGTYQNFAIWIQSNSNTNSVTFRSRKNAANGNMSISIAGGATGVTEDTSHSDTVAAGDDYDYSFTSGSGTVNFTPGYELADFISTNQDQIFSSTSNGPEQINTNVTTNVGLTGDTISRTSTESEAQLLIQLAFVFSELTANVNTNNITNASTLTLRANGAGTSLSVSITGSGSGVFSNSNASNDYTAATTDVMNYRLVTGSAGTNMKLQQLSVWGNLTPASPSTPSGFPENFKCLVEKPGAPKLNGFGNQAPNFGI